jgi:hypothetical protein
MKLFRCLVMVLGIMGAALTSAQAIPMPPSQVELPAVNYPPMVDVSQLSHGQARAQTVGTGFQADTRVDHLQDAVSLKEDFFIVVMAVFAVGVVALLSWGLCSSMPSNDASNAERKLPSEPPVVNVVEPIAVFRADEYQTPIATTTPDAMKLLRYPMMIIGVVGAVLTLPNKLGSPFVVVFAVFVVMFVGAFFVGNAKAFTEPAKTP